MLNSQPLWKLAALAIAVAACAPGIEQNQDHGFLPAPEPEGPTLVVRNDYAGEMDVYAITGSMRTRIGSVSAGRTANFRIPASLLVRQELQFQIDPVGPIEPFTYQPLSVGPGNVLELSVAPALAMSSYAIIINP